MTPILGKGWSGAAANAYVRATQRRAIDTVAKNIPGLMDFSQIVRGQVNIQSYANLLASNGYPHYAAGRATSLQTLADSGRKCAPWCYRWHDPNSIDVFFSDLEDAVAFKLMSDPV